MSIPIEHPRQTTPESKISLFPSPVNREGNITGLALPETSVSKPPEATEYKLKQRVQFLTYVDGQYREIEEDLNGRSIEQLAKDINETVFGVRTLKRYMNVKIRTENGEIVNANIGGFDVSGITYVSAQVFTIEQLKGVVPHPESLITEMEARGAERVVKTGIGKWFEFRSIDSVNPPKNTNLASEESKHILTPGILRILKLIAMGKKYSEIAIELKIEESSVREMVSANAFKPLGANCRLNALLICDKLNILDLKSIYDKEDLEKVSGLTEKEYTVLALMTKELGTHSTNIEIADSIHRSSNNVRTIMIGICKKMNAKTREHAALMFRAAQRIKFED